MVLSTEKFFGNFCYFGLGKYNLLLCYFSYPFRNAINNANDDDSSASPHMYVPWVHTTFLFEQLHHSKKHTTISHCCFCLFVPKVSILSPPMFSSASIPFQGIPDDLRYSNVAFPVTRDVSNLTNNEFLVSGRPGYSCNNSSMKLFFGTGVLQKI